MERYELAKRKKFNKAILLFEVALAVLLVSLASLFLLRGYSIFLKAGKRSLDSLKLILFSEEKVWDLQVKERNKRITENMETKGVFNPYFSWGLIMKDSRHEDLKKCILKINHERRKESFDTVIYLINQRE